MDKTAQFNINELKINWTVNLREQTSLELANTLSFVSSTVKKCLNQ